jgi:3-methylcrotonyl-CoA carboxylase alpha subunit
MFTKILVANRGVIACRVIRTARRLGVRTVAVYSDADAPALHVDMADEAYRIGPPPSRESYLRIDAVLQAARRSCAQAVHPGYGFLSENAAFAEACAKAGIVFIGPPAAVIRAMGNKSEAKALMAAAGIPVVAGYHGIDQDTELLRREARRIGWPVLIKAAAGGGGKGMRVAAGADEFEAQLVSAKREAAAAFGDDRVLLERYLERPRHVEVQVFADAHGNCVHLFERDCSIQRRHQKVIEEAPAPGLPAEVRRKMGEAAVAASRAVGYVGAGTVEFLYLPADASFSFMEMNTRLQVEHPVTELITGQDLVEWQFRVAAGEQLPVRQEDLTSHGHAVEARLYAEDPDRDFLPQTGTLDYLSFPASGPHLRIDAGVRAGDEISIHYDPLVAKLIVWDNDRAAAVRRLCSALEEARVVGLTTNLPFLSAIARHAAFIAAELDTNFIERHLADLLPVPARAPVQVLALAALGVLLERAARARAETAASVDPFSPWGRTDGWRLNDETHDSLTLRDVGGERTVELVYRRDGYLLTLPGSRPLMARGEFGTDGALDADLDGVRVSAVWVRRGNEITVFHSAVGHRLSLVDPLADASARESPGGRLIAPMPGKVIAVLTEAGAKVSRGHPLIVLEAMKMEHTLRAPEDGTVKRVRYAVGDLIEEDAELIEFEVTAATR